LKKLDTIVGLQPVKDMIRALHAQLLLEQQKRDMGMESRGSSSTLHMIFEGNPGTGKTTVARVVAELLKALGLLRTGHLVEVDRSSLVAGYSGQTALKTRTAVESALGGVLFVDEAYSLVGEDGKDSFGKEALDTLIKLVEDFRSDLVVILAGYSVEMGKLLDSNPGLRSRFPNALAFDDYTPEELLEIADQMLLQDYLLMSDAAASRLNGLLHRSAARRKGPVAKQAGTAEPCEISLRGPRGIKPFVSRLVAQITRKRSCAHCYPRTSKAALAELLIRPTPSWSDDACARIFSRHGLC